MNRNLLVTGAAGFIGRSLVKQLAESGYCLDALDSFRFSNRSQIVQHKNIRWIEGDTRDWQLVEKLAKGKQVVNYFVSKKRDDIASDMALRALA